MKYESSITPALKLHIIKVYIPEVIVWTAFVPSSAVVADVVPPKVVSYNNTSIHVSVSINNNTNNHKNHAM